MKTKFILPIIALGLFAACSDDSSSTGPDANSTTESSSSVEPESSDAVDPESSESAKPEPSAAEETVPQEPIRKEIENTIPNNVATEVEDFADYLYYGAELSGTDQFTYGRFEARMKMVSISGSVSSMFLYYDPSYMLKKQPWNEIDIEVLGTNPGSWQSNLITREADTSSFENPKITSEYKTGFGFNSTEDFHLFAFVWTPEYISWEIDSVEIRRDVLGMEKGQVEFMTKQQTLRFNLWASKHSGWTGKFTGAELADGPVAQEIDYVRVYSYDTETKTFTKAWQDDFDGDALDTKHWSKGDWPMENVKLSKDNVVVEDGKCKLLMSRKKKEEPAAD